MASEFIYITWTCPTLTEAREVARILVEKRMIACATIVPEVESIYSWEGKIENSKECKVLCKTQKKLFEKVEGLIKKNCSYEVPEILQIAIEGGSKAYLEWMKRVTS